MDGAEREALNDSAVPALYRTVVRHPSTETFVTQADVARPPNRPHACAAMPPIGSALFGYFGDRIGRKRTLVASLLTMGVSTVAIGLLPGYDSIGLWAPVLLFIVVGLMDLTFGALWVLRETRNLDLAAVGA